MKEPTWATELLVRVMTDEGRSRKPKINWGYSQSVWRQGSSGNYNPRRNCIRVVTKGDFSIEQKQVFLHELCHWLTVPRGSKKRVFFYGEPRKKKFAWHGKRFYLKLHELLVRYDALTPEYQKREAEYMSRSVNYL